jgi:hypothetical protein
VFVFAFDIIVVNCLAPVAEEQGNRGQGKPGTDGTFPLRFLACETVILQLSEVIEKPVLTRVQNVARSASKF